MLEIKYLNSELFDHQDFIRYYFKTYLLNFNIIKKFKAILKDKKYSKLIFLKLNFDFL